MGNYQKLKTLLVLLVTVVVANSAVAAPRSVAQAKQEAMRQMSRQAVNRVANQGGAIGKDPQLVFSKAKANEPDAAYYYVFSAGEGRGFTVVSGDDRLPAIIGYTEEGNYDADQLPENFVSFMESYQNFVDHASAVELAKAKSWRATTTAHESIAPLLTSKWNQGAPYNNMCPQYNGMTSVTGCVATAMAQVLYYHRFPLSLQEDIPAYTTWSLGIWVPTITAGETYDWNNMQDVYTGSETNAQNDAVAKLMLHAGCSVEMDYTPGESGASLSAEAFVKYFGMDKETTRTLWRWNHDIAEWDEILYKELEEERPIIYLGQSTGGGHAFDIDGYRDGLYHVNWGWGGMCDGYFDITILNPDNTTGTGASSTQDGYSMDNYIILGIQPDNGVVDEINNPLVSSNQDMILGEAQTMDGTVSGVIYVAPGNNSLTDGVAYVGIGYKADDGSYVNTVDEPFVLDAQDLSIGWYYYNVLLSFSFQYEEGKAYELVLIESQDKVNWKPCAGASLTALALQIQDNTIIEGTGSALSAVATLDTENSGGYAGMANTINITVTNSGAKEYYDYVTVYASDSDIMPYNYTYRTGITAPADGSTTFNFAYTPATDGTYNFWIFDRDGNQIGTSSIEFAPTTQPNLSFVSITCSNASTDKTIAEYSGSMLEMDKVNDTKADFVFEIKNDGGYYQGSFAIYEYHGGNSWSGTLHTLTLPENSTTSFTFTVEGNVGDVVGAMLLSWNDDVPIQDLPSDKWNIHDLYENGAYTGYYYFFVNSEICYLAGPDGGLTDGISATQIGNDGDKSNNIIYTLDGKRLSSTHVKDLPKGIYIINGKKVVVK